MTLLLTLTSRAFIAFQIRPSIHYIRHFRQHPLSLSLLGHEVGRVVGAAGRLVVDARVELPHLEEVEGRLVDAVVGKRLPCRGDCGVRGLPVPGQDPGELDSNSIRFVFLAQK